jgi:NAD(P)-dependent dehydrogenase (short-subunit alcohol dehydrogenase family)
MITSPLGVLSALAAALGAEVVDVPACPVAVESNAGSDAAWRHAEALGQWRAVTARGQPCSAVVVAVWPDRHDASPLIEISPTEFARRAEWPFAAWYAALGAAVSRCADGGTIVAVAERPSPLDCAGWSPESGIADAVEAMVRSLARSEGHRGVRVNAVSTPSRLAPANPIAPAPPLSAFPGTVGVEVLEAVAMLLGPGISGITGTIVHADCGRSWR